MNIRWKVIFLILLLGNLFITYRATCYRAGANDWKDKYRTCVSDFSKRSQYLEENMALKAKDRVNNRVVLLGSQVIEKWNFSDSNTGIEIINRGISGQWAAGFLLRFKPDVIDIKPAMVIIEISSYNFRPQHDLTELIDYVSEMTDLARCNGITPILTTMIPLRKDAQIEFEDMGNYNVKANIEAYNKWITDYCNENEIKYIDFNGILADQEGSLIPQYSDESINPNKEGYKLMFDAMLKAIGDIRILTQ